jgi:hypothetical protein
MRIDEVLQRIQGEFLEMPGARFLAQTRDGAFVRMEGARATHVTSAPTSQRLAVA